MPCAQGQANYLITLAMLELAASGQARKRIEADSNQPATDKQLRYLNFLTRQLSKSLGKVSGGLKELLSKVLEEASVLRGGGEATQDNVLTKGVATNAIDDLVGLEQKVYHETRASGEAGGEPLTRQVMASRNKTWWRKKSKKQGADEQGSVSDS